MCCGSVNNRGVIRSYPVPAKIVPSQKTPIIGRVARKQNVSTPVSIQRQYVIPRTPCPKCGSPTMLVHISNRERQQCTNIDCRLVIQ